MLMKYLLVIVPFAALFIGVRRSKWARASCLIVPPPKRNCLQAVLWGRKSVPWSTLESAIGTDVFWRNTLFKNSLQREPLAQLDRASVYGTEG